MTPAQKRFARAILRGDNEGRAAHAAGVNLNTVRRWRNGPRWHEDVVAYQWTILLEELLPAVRKILMRTKTTPALGRLLEILNPLRTAAAIEPQTFAELARLADEQAVFLQKAEEIPFDEEPGEANASPRTHEEHGQEKAGIDQERP